MATVLHPADQALRDKGVHVMNIAAGNIRGTAMAEQTVKQSEAPLAQ